MSGIDIYYTRRGMYNLCQFWDRDESGVGNSEEYTYYNLPDGTFYAKEANNESNEVQTLFGSFMADSHSILLESHDDLNGLRENCLVKFDNCLWRVENIQKKIRRKQSEFNPNFDYVWYIQLRR